jgi:hypothetical protein
VTAAVVIVCGLIMMISFPRGFSAGLADQDGGGYYQRLADGFLHGELSIRDRPPQWLVDDPDHYNPRVSTQWADRYGRWDSILWGDRVYYYWGPAPVVLFVVPMRILGIHATETDIGIAAALVLAIAVGLLVRRIASRWPMPWWLEFFLTLGLAATFSAFHQLRNVAIWQATVLAAGAFGMLALYGFVSAALAPAGSRRALWWWFFGGATLACAIGTRPTYAAFALVPLAFIAIRYLRRRGGGVTLRSTVGPLVAALGPVVAVGVVFALYNQARFGSPTDFGIAHQLSPSVNQSTVVQSSLAYLLPNAYYYLVRPVSFSPAFPFLAYDAFQWSFHLPTDYNYNEPVLGVLTTSPLLVLGMLVVLRGAFARRARRDLRFVIAATLTILGFATVAAVSVSIFGAVQRYRVEGDLLFTAAAIAAVSLAWTFLRGRRVRRIFAGGVVALSVVSITFAVLTAYQNHYPFTGGLNWFGKGLASITQPLQDAALASKPYVSIEPVAELQGPFRLNEGTSLYPNARIDVFRNGECPVRIVLDRDPHDREPLSVSAGGLAHVDVSPKHIVLEVPAGVGEILPLTTLRYDGGYITKIQSGTSTYDCGWTWPDR